MNRNRSSQKYITLFRSAHHAYLPDRIPIHLRQNCFRMPLLLLLSLIASIAAPLCSGADKVMGATADSTRTEAPTEQSATGKLTLLREVKNRAEMVHFVTYNPEPRFELWVPTELRTEYDAIPTETEKFAWLAEHFRVQFENGDILSGNDLGILHLYGLGVEKDWKKAQELFVEPIKKGRWVGQRYLAELLLRSPEQPQNARLAAELLIPMLKARNWYGVWAACEANFILSKSENPADKALAEQMFELCTVPGAKGAPVRALQFASKQKDFQKMWRESSAILASGEEMSAEDKLYVKGIYAWSGCKSGKLFTELSWSQVVEVLPQKYQYLPRLLPFIGFGFLLILLSGLCLWTRFRRKPNMGFLLLLVWFFGFLIFSLILFGSPIAVFLYCPIALFLLWFGLRGSNPFPYLVSPQEKYGSFQKTWLEIGIACVLLYAAVYALAVGYGSLYQWISGSELPPQAIGDILISKGLSGKMATILAVGIFIPALEEIVFRGFLHDWLSRKLPLAAAMILGSLLFGFIHGIDYGIPIAGLGLACLWLRIRYASLIPCILLHALNNIGSIIIINL
jgi:membrane protease YdiL (CAAX protease family)